MAPKKKKWPAQSTTLVNKGFVKHAIAASTAAEPAVPPVSSPVVTQEYPELMDSIPQSDSPKVPASPQQVRQSELDLGDELFGEEDELPSTQPYCEMLTTEPASSTVSPVSSVGSAGKSTVDSDGAGSGGGATDLPTPEQHPKTLGPTPDTPTTATTPETNGSYDSKEVLTAEEEQAAWDAAFGVDCAKNIPALESLKEVSTLADIMSWPEHAFAVLEDKFGRDILFKLAAALARDDSSTAFSGVEAPQTAKTFLRLRLETYLGITIPCPPHKFAIEVDTEAQYEILSHPDSPDCLFGDIGQFWVPAVQDILAGMKRRGEAITVGKLLPITKSRKAVRLKGWCLRHRKYCSLTRTSSHTAGPPCVGFSSIGKSLKDEDPSVEFFMAWCAIVLVLLFPIVLHENVPQCALALLALIFGEAYDIDETILEPVTFGVPSRRRRAYRLLKCKDKIHNVLFPLCSVPQMFARECNATWRVYFVAQEWELSSELAWARSRANSKFWELSEADKNDIDNRKDKWRNALTGYEVGHLNSYEQTCALGRVWSLTQDANKHPICSGEDELQTILKHCGLLWNDELKRWMTPNEVLMSMGNPTISTPGMQLPLACSFQVDRTALGLPPRSRNAKLHQAGNSMNVNVMGYLTIYRLLFVEKLDDTILASIGHIQHNLKRRRSQQLDDHTGDDEEPWPSSRGRSQTSKRLSQARG